MHTEKDFSAQAVLTAVDPAKSDLATVGADELLTKEKLAPRLHVGIRTIENWQRRGVLPYIKIGKIVLFVWSDVVEAVKKFRICRKTTK